MAPKILFIHLQLAALMLVIMQLSYKRCHSIKWSVVPTAPLGESEREGGDGAAAPGGDDVLYHTWPMGGGLGRGPF